MGPVPGSGGYRSSIPGDRQAAHVDETREDWVTEIVLLGQERYCRSLFPGDVTANLAGNPRFVRKSERT
jgi:hypothetical protein